VEHLDYPSFATCSLLPVDSDGDRTWTFSITRRHAKLVNI